MLARIFDSSALVFFLVFALAGFVLSTLLGALWGEEGRSLLRGLEALILTLVGGWIARAFIAVLLAATHDTPAGGLAIGWGFLFLPGAVDTVARMFGEQWLTTPTALLWIASAVGAFTGMMDGLWGIRRWNGISWLSFPLDLTWGLAGSANGCLLHLFNFAWADHDNTPDARADAHRYTSGFRFKTNFALTQGAVMSDMTVHNTRSDLFRHEYTHVWQNRIFGPLFTLTYLGWMIVWALPGMVAGGAVGAGPFQGAEKWSYFNNPWEAWAYAVGCGPRTAFGYTPEQRQLIWPDLFVILWSIPFFGVVLFLMGLVVNRVF